MSWHKSLWYTHQLMGIHPWTSYMIDVVALQHALKEAHHDLQVAKEFTHERTKQHIAHLNAAASSAVYRSHLTTLVTSPRGCSMTQWADCLFVQEQLWDLWIAKPVFPHHPVLLDNRLETLHPEQYDSAQDCEGDYDDEDDAASQLDADQDVSTGKEMDIFRHLHQ